MSETHRWPAPVVGVLLSFVCLFAVSLSTHAQSAVAGDEVSFEIPAQPLDQALVEFGRQSRQELFYNAEDVSGLTANAVSGVLSRSDAMARLLTGTGMEFEQTPSGGMMVADRATLDAQRAQREAASTVPPAEAASAKDAGAADIAAARRAGVEEIIVTGQKKEERLQDVPIAISAFSSEDLNAFKIEGGFDLLKAIPNVTFSKNNFTSYNFSIRGVGTKAVSATTDPGVAVAFNSSTIIQNRLFEQEYYDIERVEVLRGPQGTLYGRNATSGVINVISNKPDLSQFDGSIKGEVGNFNTKRLNAMLNVPLIDGVLGVRLAGALTSRDGYDYNSVTENPVNGRDLSSTRLTVGFQPSDAVQAHLIWERFTEDDDRLRTGKQLCHRDAGPTVVGDTPVFVDDPTNSYNEANKVLGPALFSQGCLPGSLYADNAFGTPNGLALPIVFGVEILGYGDAFPIGRDADGNSVALLGLQDPYGGMMQSRDLRQIASFRDPRYRAEADLLELNVDIEVSPTLTLTSQTAYVDDQVYSFQDFNRFNTVPVFTDTSQVTPADFGFGEYDWSGLAPGGVFCDPQLGCSDTMAGFDISQATAEQFSQELRLQSDFEGPFNFSIGANFTRFDALVDYYIFSNLLTAQAYMAPFNAPVNGVIDFGVCHWAGFYGLFPGPGTPVATDAPDSSCPYIDPNPIGSINGEGHNYFRSKNPYELESRSAFGEFYWEASAKTKLTLGLRYTEDEKRFTPVPSQALLSPSFIAGGTVSRGYPEKPDIVQRWGEWTGRLGVDWKPDFAFTDETLLYAFYSRGYKGGGANPPRPGFATEEELRAIAPDETDNFDQQGFPLPILQLTAVEYAPVFEPEFVNAFEIGMKNTVWGGAATINATAFYYDYTDYQVSQIRDRSAVNENFDATVWGLELETLVAFSNDFQMVANFGYLNTRIADGETSIDIINRTQGNPDYTLAKAWLQLPSNCVVPTAVAEQVLQDSPNVVQGQYWQICGGLGGLLGAPALFPLPTDPATGQAYDVANYPELNGGAGLKADLSGNELPNAPHWTANIGAQYGIDLFRNQWRATLRGDVYWQSDSYHRVYNFEPYDRLKGWHNVNLAVRMERPEDGLALELYAKNLIDDTPITDAFLNSDDTGLTTNVFVLDPRLIGFSITKTF